MILAGTLLLVLTGFCWVGIAATISVAARRRLDIDLIQAATAAVCVTTAGAVLLLWPPEKAPPLLLMLTVAAAGAGNYLMIRLLKIAMACGDNGAVWGITQSALIFPFLMGMVFFGVAPNAANLTGIVLILTAIVLFARAKSDGRHRRGKNWLKPTFAAFLVSGLSQCFANLPSYLAADRMGNVLRTFLVQAGVLTLFSCHTLLTHRKFRGRGIAIPTLVLSLANLLSLFFFFYRGLNLLAAAGVGAIGYPIAQGSCIAGFLLYSRIILKERFQPLSLAALIAVLAGIVVIAL